jgi:hypothetical protein
MRTLGFIPSKLSPDGNNKPITFSSVLFGKHGTVNLRLEGSMYRHVASAFLAAFVFFSSPASATISLIPCPAWKHPTSDYSADPTAVVFFAAGYLTSKLQDAQAFDSINYTNLLTASRWRLLVLDALDSSNPMSVRESLIRALRSDRMELENYEREGKLGAEGSELLKRVASRTSS